MDEPAQRARAWGVDLRYENYAHEEQIAPAETVGKILEIMGAEGAEPPPSGAQVITSLSEADLRGAVEIDSEDGGSERIGEALPADLPLGYHRLRRRDDSVQALVVSPGTCMLPAGRLWGWAIQLYSARSRSSWGIGDLGDLGRFARWAGSQGAGAIMVNPLHAPLPIAAQQPSPYFPSSRCFRNPIYLDIDAIEGAQTASALEELRDAAREVNETERIDRDAIHPLKLAALEELWAKADRTAFLGWAAGRGEALWTYATFAALAEHHGGGPQTWPEGLAQGHPVALSRWRGEHEDRVAFHAWIQWLLERQLEEVRGGSGLINDLAIGVDPEGADAWVWKDSFAQGVTVGAPPDEFALEGQNWGLPPFDPWKLRAAGYEPFIETIRSAFRHSAGIRIDHVMGLFRLFWIPEGKTPAAGTYVHYPYEDLLNIVSLESHRAGAYVIGEDLGTVEDRVRDEMQARNMLSYRLLWFEDELPQDYPEPALAAVTNHDLPTIAGMWTGSDVKDQLGAGLEVNHESTDAQRARLQEWLELPDDAPLSEVVANTYELLAAAPCALVMATLEDALLVEQRPNLPGTTHERANWSTPLPLPLEEIGSHPLVRRVGSALSKNVGPNGPTSGASG